MGCGASSGSASKPDVKKGPAPDGKAAPDGHFCLVALSHPTAIDKLGIAAAAALDHKMLGVCKDYSGTKWQDGLIITNINAISKECFGGPNSPEYAMRWGRDWKEHKEKNDMADGNTSVTTCLCTVPGDSADAVVKLVEAALTGNLPQVYVAETDHTSDCHMVVKVAAWIYGDGPYPPPYNTLNHAKTVSNWDTIVKGLAYGSADAAKEASNKLNIS